MKKSILLASLLTVASAAMAQNTAPQALDKQGHPAPKIVPGEPVWPQDQGPRAKGPRPDYGHGHEVHGPGKLKKHGDHLARVQRHIERDDANKDGKLSLAEFMAHPANMFNAMDADGDKLVSAEEMAEFHKKKMAEMQRRGERKFKMHQRDAAARERTPAEADVPPAGKPVEAAAK